MARCITLDQKSLSRKIVNVGRGQFHIDLTLVALITRRLEPVESMAVS